MGEYYNSNSDDGCGCFIICFFVILLVIVLTWEENSDARTAREHEAARLAVMESCISRGGSWQPARNQDNKLVPVCVKNGTVVMWK